MKTYYYKTIIWYLFKSLVCNKINVSRINRHQNFVLYYKLIFN